MSTSAPMLHKRKREVEVMVSESDELYNTIAKMMKDDDDSKNKHGRGCYSNQLIIPSICRVPETLRKLKDSAYTPRMVSIGLLHRDDERLQGMQKHKVSYMRTLFDRTPKSQEMREDQTLHECVEAMIAVAPRARTCYGQTFKDHQYSNVGLANTLLVDGCFILELLFRWKHQIIESDDPVLLDNLAKDGIRRDLLLLENQIPFFVLQKLYQLTLHKIQNPPTPPTRHFTWIHSELSLQQYVLEFFGHMMIFGSKMIERDNGITETRYHHILGFLHKYYQPASNGDPGDYPVMKYSATQLNRTGVKFKASEGKDYVRVRFRTSCFMFSWLGRCNTRHESTSEEEETWNHRVSTETSCICNLFSRLRTLLSKTPPFNSSLFQLCRSACLELPQMRVYDSTELFLRNLIAYEQCCLTVPHYISSYAFLMDTLINSKEDVELLEDEGVLQNYLGASEDASALFNNLCKETIMGDFYFSHQWNQLTDYCKLYWPQHLASLRSTYFSNPWAIISLIGALILFGLTAVQTAYSIK